MKVSKVLLAVMAVFMIFGVGACNADAYKPTEQSLAKHGDAPEWFRDAKLGIYFHWGVYSVPAFGSEWYPRNMYMKGNKVYKHHVETWGDPAEFPYTKFVPMFKAQKFDPDQWAELFKKAGAKFAGPVAEHHDGFAMWDSEYTPWNAADKGPKRDITGELEKAIRNQGMRFIATFHHAKNSLWQRDGKWTGHYDHVKKSYPSLLENQEDAILYGYMPRDKFVEMWKNKLIEVIDNYQPDIIWFDSWLDQIPEKDRFDFAAYYFNKAKQAGKEVVIVRKQKDMPIEFSVLDLEKSRQTADSPRVWMTDDTISTGSWCYTSNLKIKPASTVIHALIDTVSKNGVVLLNVSPKADGTIPQDQQDVLLELGQWLKIYGPAIYETRPWVTYGEGPTKEPKGGFSDRKKFINLKYSTKDIRYTASKDGKTIFAIVMGVPQPAEVIKLSALAEYDVQAKKVSLLGSSEKISFRKTDDALMITCPEYIDGDYAAAFKIETK